MARALDQAAPDDTNVIPIDLSQPIVRNTGKPKSLQSKSGPRRPTAASKSVPVSNR